jgi:hypothetical protein
MAADYNASVAAAQQGYKTMTENVQAPINFIRKTRALNALAKVYGPEALDPASFQTVEAARVNQANANRTNALAPLEVQQKEQEIAQAEQINPLLVQEKQQTIDAGAQSLQTGQIKLDATKAAMYQQGLGTLHSMMSDALAAGKAPEKVWNGAMASVQKLTGVKPEQFAPYREQFMANPQATVEQLGSQFAAAQQAAVTPKQRVEMQKLGMEIQKVQAETGRAVAQTAKAEKEAALKEAEQAAIVPDLTKQYINHDRIAERVKGLLDQVGPDGSVTPGQITVALDKAADLSETPWRNAAGSYVPGSAFQQYYAAIEPITDQLSLIDLQNMKGAGVTFGRVTNVEFQALGKAYQNLTNPNQSRSQFLRNLAQVRKTLPKVLAGYRIEQEMLKKQIQAAGGDPAQAERITQMGEAPENLPPGSAYGDGITVIPIED